MTKKFIYLPKKILEEANNASIREGRNRNLEPKWVRALDENFNAIVMFEHYHTRDEIRLVLKLTLEGPPGFLDVSRMRFESLPRATVDDNGNYIYETEEELQERRPYPNGREWQESVIKKPVRKQASFRKDVLAAYENSCAICPVSESSLLRAAHIMDVADGGPDCVTNGICLCVNHEISFDRGLISIGVDYSLKYSKNLGESDLVLRLPKEKEKQPLAQYLEFKLNKLNKPIKQD
jgi:putative restriction endonuclease